MFRSEHVSPRAEVVMPGLTESERRIYERARRLWLAAALHVKGEGFLRPTLGARVSRAGGWVGRAS